MTRYSYALSDGTTTFHGTGTLSVSLSGTSVVGSGTAFTSQLTVGGILFNGSGSIIGSVSVITDNTHLTLANGSLLLVSAAVFDYNNPINVETFTNGMPPKSTPVPWSQALDLGDGTARGMGRPRTSWTFGFVKQGFRDAFRVYCTGKSARVFIRSRDIDSADSYKTYQAVMLWPDQESRDATRRVPFTLEFRDLVQI